MLVAVLGGLVLGVLACAIEWQPDAHTTFTGFPFPIGVDVVRPDGSVDCGSGPQGLVLNQLAFGAAILAVLLAARWARRVGTRRG